MYESVKIMGERNSGTNFLQSAVYQNFTAHVHLESGRLSRAQSLQVQAEPTPKARALLTEKLLDALHLEQAMLNGGWKHAALHIDALDRFSQTRNVLFLCITRHPATWLRAMHRAPFHMVGPAAKAFSDFIRQPWQTRLRDDLDIALLPSPVALWVQKNRLFHRANQARENVRLIRYETLVEAFEPTLAALPLARRARRELFVPIANARSFIPDKTDYHTYKARIAMDPWAGYTDADKAHVLAELDANLMSELSYH
tara:strand:- start:197 stop:964 length:768 start_codon:yes stop_codon:yes gene_type:complete